jgi:hypothetical protein
MQALLLEFKHSGQWVDRLHGELLKLVGTCTQFCSKDKDDDGAGGALTAVEIFERKIALKPLWAKDAQKKLEHAMQAWLLRFSAEALTHPDVLVTDFEV